MPLANRYTLTVTPEQARVLQEACELLARCHMGQFDHMVFAVAPLTDRWECDSLLLDLKRAVFPELRSYGSSYGITSEKRPDEARVAWDLYTLIRHRLSHDRLEPGQEPNRACVYYREPDKLSKEPRGKIEAYE